VIGDQVRDDFRDQFHKIAASLYDLRERNDVRVVMIASATPAEGKTLTAINLALTLSGSYSSRVLLIDADLRRPSVHRVLGLANERGLTDCVAHHGGDPLPAINVLDYLTVLPAGVRENAVDSASPLIADLLRVAITEARLTSDWIVVDTPPVQFMPDAQIVAGLVDAAVLVVHAGSTPCALAQRAVETIGRERVVGVVLNQVTSAFGQYPYYGYDRQSRWRVPGRSDV
jgi:protein-tyrosine kinase